MATRKAATILNPTILTTMKAAAIDRFGPPSVLRPHTLPVPTPGPQDILIALHASGVGVWDASVRDGSWKPYGRPRFPIVLGTDGAGVVAAKGTRVRQFRVGDRVYGVNFTSTKAGFYAEFTAIKVRNAARVPKVLDLLQAGAAPVPGLTALQGIDDALRVRKGETILIFGGSGAVGTLAIQFAKRHNARVVATASGRAAAALVKRLGAHAVFDPRKDDAVNRLRALAPRGLDAVLALAGGPVLEQCLDLVRPNGRVAYPNGVEPEPTPRSKVRFRAYDGIVGPREFARLERAAVEARLRVPIAEVYPLEQAAKAHVRLQRGHILGRIVLRIRRGRL